MAEEQKPSVGRIVHYVDEGKRCCPAMVIEVFEDDSVFVAVFPQSNYTGQYDLSAAVATHYEASRPFGTWHWPERV